MAKKEEMKLDIPLEGVMAKLQMARVMLQEENLKKTGKNDFAHFDFFQLEDFLPKINEIFVKLGLHSEFNITPETVDYTEETVINATNKEVISVVKTPIIKEIATLVITDVTKPDDFKVYEMEVAPVMIGNNTRQNIYQAAGGRNTYYKRYLYMNALEIVEKDESDTVLGQEGVNYQQPTFTSKETMNNQFVANNIESKPAPEYVANNITQPDPNLDKGDLEAQQLENVATNLENTVDTLVNEKEPLTAESKIEIMNLVNQKGLNGASIIADFCKQSGLAGTNDLLEIHKQPLIDMVNSYNG